MALTDERIEDLWYMYNNSSPTDGLISLREFVHAIEAEVLQTQDVGCTRSHPHENMSAECEAKTVEARKNFMQAQAQEPVAVGTIAHYNGGSSLIKALTRIAALPPPLAQEPVSNATLHAWVQSLNKGVDRCRQYADQGDAETIEDIIAYLTDPQPPAPCPSGTKQPPCTNEHVAEGCEQFPETDEQEMHRTLAGLYSKNAILLLRNKELQAKGEQITETDNTANLAQRIEQFDRAITRIGHHVSAVCAGVDTEDEHGPGGHSAVAIIEKFEALQAKVAEITEYNSGLCDKSNGYVVENARLSERVAEQSAEIERLTKAVTPQPLPDEAVPHAFMLEETRRYASYWEDGARNDSVRSTALICLHQSVNGWKNAAYSMAEKLLSAQSTIAQQAERIAELEAQRDNYFAICVERAQIIQRQTAMIEKCEKGLSAVEWLISDSQGVIGLHLNGDSAPWASLRTGGHFETWLIEFDEVLAAITAHKRPPSPPDLHDSYEQVADFSAGNYKGI